MSDEAIKHDQIIEENVFENSSSSADVLIKKLDVLIERFVSLIKITGKKIPLTDPKTLTEAEQLAAALKRITDLENGLTAVQKVKIQAQAIANKQNAEYRNHLKAEESAYQKLSIQLQNQKKQVKDLLAAKKELTEADKKLIIETQELDKRLKEIDSTVGDNQRRVGAYKEVLNDVRAELGAFGGVIGKLVNSLKELHEQNEKATTSTQKLGNGLKLAGATIALVAILAVIKGFELLKEASGSMADEMENLTARWKTFFVTIASGNGNISESIDLTDIWIETLQQSRREVRQLGLEIGHLSTLLEEQNQIANDSTIGFNERINAQKKSIELEDEIAKKQLKRAESEFNVIEKEIQASQFALKGKRVNNELLEKEAEAIKKVDEARAKISLLELEDAAKIRQLNIDKTDQLIDLTLKSKQSAHARKTILEEELKDNTRYLSERRKINEELFQNNNQTVAEEIKIYKEGRQVQFDFNKLVIQQNEVLLAQEIAKIKTRQGHGLDTAGVVELSKIVKQAQENEIANQKIINDLAKEEMRNYEKIADITREIELIKFNDNVHDSAVVLKEKTDLYEKINKDLLEKQNIWDFKMEKLRNFYFDLLLSQEEASYDAQKEFLEKKEKDAEAKANNTIVDTKVLNAEILKLQTQLNTDLQNLEIDKINKEKALMQKKKEDDKKLRDERIDAEFKVVQQINDGIKAGLEKRSEIQQSADQRDIDMHQRMLEVQTRLAAEGRANVLAETLAQTAKAEEKKLQDAKKAAKQQQTLALIETFEKTLQAALKADKPFIQAFGEALAAEGIVASAFSALFSGFYDGTDSLGENDGIKIGTGKDNLLIRAHPGERILGVDDSKELAGLTNKEVKDAALAYMNPDLKTTFFPKMIDTQISQSQYYEQKAFLEMKNEIKAMRQSFENRPIQTNNLGNLGEWTEKIQQNNMKTIIHHKKNSSKPSLRLNG